MSLAGAVLAVWCKLLLLLLKGIDSNSKLSPSEVLTLDESDGISGVTEIGPELWQMQFYPELFLVDANFCEV